MAKGNFAVKPLACGPCCHLTFYILASFLSSIRVQTIEIGADLFVIEVDFSSQPNQLATLIGPVESSIRGDFKDLIRFRTRVFQYRVPEQWRI